MAPMAGRAPLRAEKCRKSPSIASLRQQLASLSVTGTERNSPTQHRRASQSQPIASLRNQPVPSPKPHQKQRSMRNNIQEAPFSGSVATSAPSRVERNLAVGSSSSEEAKLEWLPSTNYGSSEISIRVTAHLLIGPRDAYFVRDIATNHNKEVSDFYPRMWFRELGDSDRRDSWELIPLEGGLGPPTPGSMRRYQLKSPLIQIIRPFTIQHDRVARVLRGIEPWQGYFEATGNFLQRNYIIQGINGFLPALFISVSTFERGLDFKRIIQALIHFNQLWPDVFPRDDTNPVKADPRIVVGNTYLSHHPEHWSAIPATGEVFFYVRRSSEVGAKSILWTQFVINFILAAISHPSLESIQSHPVTMQGLNSFVIGNSSYRR